MLVPQKDLYQMPEALEEDIEKWYIKKAIQITIEARLAGFTAYPYVRVNHLDLEFDTMVELDKFLDFVESLPEISCHTIPNEAWEINEDIGFCDVKIHEHDQQNIYRVLRIWNNKSIENCQSKRLEMYAKLSGPMRELLGLHGEDKRPAMDKLIQASA